MSIINTVRNWIGRAFRFSLENPKYSLSDPNVMSLLGGDTSETKALSLSSVFRAISLISGSVGKLPCTIYKRIVVEGRDGKERDPTHQAYQIVRYEPNDEMTQTTYREVQMKNVLTWGNAYAFIRKENSRPVELIPMSPQSTQPIRKGGQLMYLNTTKDGRQALFDQSEIIHIKNVSDDGIEGLNVLQLMCRVLRLGTEAQEWAASFFANSCTPSSVLSHPETLDEEAQKRLRKSVESLHRGSPNAHRAMILEEGMTFTPLSFTAKDSQMVENVKLNRVDVANFFGVPPHKLGDDSRTSFSSLEQENQSYLDEAVDPWLVRFEQEYRRKLFTEAQKESDSHLIEFNRNALVQADLKARMESYKIATAGRAFMTPDEVRAAENMNPMGGESSELIDPTNNFAPAEPEGDDSRSALVELAYDATDATRARLTTRVGKSWSSAKRKGEAGTYAATFEAKHAQYIRAELAPAYRILEALGEDVADWEQTEIDKIKKEAQSHEG